MHDDVEIVIPVQHESAQLERSLGMVEKTASGVPVRVMVEPKLNVSECRQMATDKCRARYVCFLDHDSEMVMPGWLDGMLEVIRRAPDAAAVYAGEWWGTELPPEIVVPDPQRPWQEVSYGPAACMLVDTGRIGDVRWDTQMGLRNGWLGPDFEEVQYAYDLRAAGRKLYRAQRTLFHHVERTTNDAFAATDRAQVIAVIRNLLEYRWAKAPEDREFFKGLVPVRARADDDKMFAPRAVNPLRTIFRPVLLRNGLQNRPSFVRRGIT